MTPRQPVTTRRTAAVMAPAIAACGLIWAAGRSCPVVAAGLIAATAAAAAWALPFPGLPQGAALAGKALRAARAWTPWPAEPDPQAARAAQAAWARAWREQEAPECTAHRGMCACGIEAHHWERFEAEMEVLASMLWPRERRRGQ